MKYKVSLNIDTEDDLFEIYKYVFQYDSKNNADNLVERLRKKCFELQDYPERGHIPPELQLANFQ
jgi:toxin ParE1/3/4